MPFQSINPYTAEHLADYPALSASEIEQQIGHTAAAQRDWRHRSVDERAALVTHLASLLRRDAEALAMQCTLEMGKTLASARSEVEKCATLCDMMTRLAPRALAPERVTEDALGAWRVEYQPLGILLAIMPWNFPYWQAMRVLVPNLVAGNAVLHKPAGSVAGCAELLHALIAEAAAEMGASAQLAPLFLVESGDIAAIIADPRIVGVTLTGSEGAGRAVAQTAGQHLKKVVLELGGSDPFVVLPDANIARAAKAAVRGRTQNAGQSCIAAKRFVICEDVYEPFLHAFREQMRALRLGDPTVPATDVGPLATADMRDTLAKQVADSVAAGARITAQAPLAEGPGFFYPPTVLEDIPDHAPAASEELFGPVASVFRVPNPDAALLRANATSFGLGASVWTRDARHAARFISELDAGMVFVNEVVVSDPRVPFGGVKQSGMGRELGTPGFREFTNAKTVRVAE